MATKAAMCKAPKQLREDVRKWLQKCCSAKQTAVHNKGSTDPQFQMQPCSIWTQLSHESWPPTPFSQVNADLRRCQLRILATQPHTHHTPGTGASCGAAWASAFVPPSNIRVRQQHRPAVTSTRLRADDNTHMFHVPQRIDTCSKSVWLPSLLTQSEAAALYRWRS